MRIEQEGDTDLTTLKTAWPEGEDIGNFGDPAYWSPAVNVLWATKNGNTYAVQLVIAGTPLLDNKAYAMQIMQALFARI